MRPVPFCGCSGCSMPNQALPVLAQSTERDTHVSLPTTSLFACVCLLGVLMAAGLVQGLCQFGSLGRYQQQYKTQTQPVVTVPA